MIINYVALVESFLVSGIMEYIFYPLLGIAFVPFVVFLFRYLMHRS